MSLMLGAGLYRLATEQDLFHQANRALRLQVETPGLLSSLCFTEDNRTQASLGAYELELRAESYGINFKDVFIALGQMLPHTLMVRECAGNVTAIGSPCREIFQVIDRACAFNTTPYSGQIRVLGSYVQKILDFTAFEVGASIPGCIRDRLL